MKEEKQKIKFFITIFLTFIQILIFNLGFIKFCKENFLEKQNLKKSYIIIKYFIIPIIIFIFSIIIFEIFLNNNKSSSNILKDKQIILNMNKFSLLKNEKEINI